MSGKTFLDTNILVYAVDEDGAARRDACRAVIAWGATIILAGPATIMMAGGEESKAA